MVRVVDGHAVEEDQVLVDAASPHIDAGRAVGAPLDARQDGDRLHQVGLAGQRREGDDLSGAHLRDAHRRRAYRGEVIVADCLHLYRPQPVLLHRQMDRHQRVMGRYCHRDPLVADE